MRNKKHSSIKFDGKHLAKALNNLINKVSYVLSCIFISPKREALRTYINDLKSSSLPALEKATLIRNAPETLKSSGANNTLIRFVYSMPVPDVAGKTASTWRFIKSKGYRKVIYVLP